MIRGIYDIYVDGSRICNMAHPYIVIADLIDPSNSSIALNYTHSLSFHDELKGEMKLRDKYNNIFGRPDWDLLLPHPQHSNIFSLTMIETTIINTLNFKKVY